MSQVAAGWWRPVSATRTAGPTMLAEEGRGGALPFRALLVFSAIMLVAPQAWLPVLKPLRPGLLSAIVALAAWSLDRFAAGRALSIWPREMTLLAALIAWSVATLPFSIWLGGSVATLLDQLLKAAAMCWLIANVVNGRRRLRRFAWGLALMSVVPALVALHNYAAGVHLAHSARIQGYEAALTSNPNDLALTLNLLLPLTAALAALSRGAVRLLLVGIVALQVAAIVATFSRAGFLVLAVSMLIGVYKLSRVGAGRWAAALIVAVVLALPLVPADYASRLATIGDAAEDRTGSATQRWNDAVAAMRYVAAHPIVGAGLGNNELALNEIRGDRWVEVHNVYLQTAMELGLPGLTLYVLLVAGCVQAAGVAARRTRSRADVRDVHVLASAIRVSVIAFALAGFFHPVAYHLYFYCVGGLALAARAVVGTATGAVDRARVASGGVVAEIAR